MHTSVVHTAEGTDGHGALHIGKQLSLGAARVQERSRFLSDFGRLGHVSERLWMNFKIKGRTRQVLSREGDGLLIVPQLRMFLEKLGLLLQLDWCLLVDQFLSGLGFCKVQLFHRLYRGQ